MASNLPKGFTTIEVLVVLAVLAIVAGLVFPFYHSFEDDSALKDAAWRTASMVRQAQLRSFLSEEDSVWGLSVNGSQAVLFMGDSYASRDPSKDEIFNANDGVVFSGDSEIVFAKVSGEPSPAAAIITVTSGADSINLNINEKGLVEY